MEIRIKLDQLWDDGANCSWDCPFLPRLGERIDLEYYLFEEVSKKYIEASWLFKVANSSGTLKYNFSDDENYIKTRYDLVSDFLNKHNLVLNESIFLVAGWYLIPELCDELKDLLSDDISKYGLNSKITDITWSHNIHGKIPVFTLELDFEKISKNYKSYKS